MHRVLGPGPCAGGPGLFLTCERGLGTLSTEGSYPLRTDMAPGCVNRGPAGGPREGTRPALPGLEQKGPEQPRTVWLSSAAPVRGAAESRKASVGPWLPQ